MKKIIALVLCAVLCVGLLSACGEKQTNGGTNSDLTLALVVAGTFGDRSFYDSSKEGCDALAKEGEGQDHRVQQRKSCPADPQRCRQRQDRGAGGLGVLRCGDHRSGVPGRAVHLDR